MVGVRQHLPRKAMKSLRTADVRAEIKVETGTYEIWRKGCDHCEPSRSGLSTEFQETREIWKFTVSER